MRKTSLTMPEPLWKRVRMVALDEGVTAKSLVIKAIELYLKTKTARRRPGPDGPAAGGTR
jgi:hypothetical protein